MAHLGIAEADIVGYSMGPNTGLQLTIRHPASVRKLVAISANYRHDGYDPETYKAIETLMPELFAASPPEAAYLTVAPNPEDFATLIQKMIELDTTDFAWPEEDIQGIAAPALLVIGDADQVRPEQRKLLGHRRRGVGIG